jgi:hypothetical protein
MIYAHVITITKFGQEADYIVAADASKIGIAVILLQEDSEGHLIPCVF